MPVCGLVWDRLINRHATHDYWFMNSLEYRNDLRGINKKRPNQYGWTFAFLYETVGEMILGI